MSSKYFLVIVFIVAALAFAVSILSYYFITVLNPNFCILLLIMAAASVFLAVLVSVGSITLFPVLSETMITLKRLIRFESLSNPLILKLSTEAPGTYHHSINVSILSQKAARAIDANSLLVRVAAYYHDIGKLEFPFAFVENQAGREIPTAEDANSIKENAKIIIDHVKNGVKIAKSNRLPEAIVDLIAEHHGTTKALYFFALAKERGIKVKKTDFKYEGPSPRSKEAAILMLADCVEATARSYSDLTETIIRKIVEDTTKEKIAEKQFRYCKLSGEEIKKIKKSLTETLFAIYHQRIEYKNDKA